MNRAMGLVVCELGSKWNCAMGNWAQKGNRAMVMD